MPGPQEPPPPAELPRQSTEPSNPHVLSHGDRIAAAQSAALSGMAAPTEARVEQAFDAMLDTVGPVAFFRTLVLLLPHAAVFVVDADRNVLCWNPVAERLLGFRREDVLGRYCLTANRCYQCMLGCGLSEYGAVVDQPLVLLNADGQPVHVRKTAQAFFDPEHRFLGGVEVLIPDAPTPPVAPSRASTQQTAASHQTSEKAAKTPKNRRSSGAGPVLRQLPSPRTLSSEDLKTKVQEALIRSEGHIGRAAELLGVSRPTLWRWRKRFGIT